jgi:hypothetical protein
MPGPSSSPEHTRHPSPSPVPVPVPSRSRAASVSEATGRRSQEDSASSAGGFAWKGKGKQRATDVLENETTSSVLSGSGRGGTSDAELDPETVNTSGDIRVRGMELELSAVRAERRAREKWWETEAETTMIREEKAGYEDKIKKLEEEVLRLQEEVRHFILLYFSLLMTPSIVGEEASDELCRSLVFHAPTAPTATSSTALTSTPCPSTDTYNSSGRGAFLL